MMERPKLKIEWAASDYLIEITGGILLLLMFGYPLSYFSDLPDMIPSHFNGAGQPDGFSQKNSVWILPCLGLVMYLGLLILNKFPHIFNYPKEITADNALHQYTLATRLMRTINMLIVASFFYINYGTIQTALGNQVGLGIYFLPFFLLSIFGSIGVYLYHALRS